MSRVERVCVQCGAGNPIEARYCAHCGYDNQEGSQAALPAQRTNLPAVIGQAALPVLFGVASLAVRVGWKFLQNRMAQSAVPKVQQPLAPQPRQEVTRPDVTLSRRAKRTIRIRSAWAINNGDGIWRQGTSEQTIEFDE